MSPFPVFVESNQTSLGWMIAFSILIPGIITAVIVLVRFSKKETKLIKRIREMDPSIQRIKAINAKYGPFSNYDCNDFVPQTIVISDPQIWSNYGGKQYVAKNIESILNAITTKDLFIARYEEYKRLVDEEREILIQKQKTGKRRSRSLNHYLAMTTLVFDRMVYHKPTISELKYSAEIVCEKTGARKDVYYSKEDIEQAKSSPIGKQSDNKKNDNSASQNIRYAKDLSMHKSASTSQPETKKPASQKQTNRSSNPIHTTTVQNVPSSDAFSRYFASIDNLEDKRYFWAALSDIHRAYIKKVIRLAFDLSAPVIPKNQPTIFAFRYRYVSPKMNQALFWFTKSAPETLIFRYMLRDGGIKTINATDEFYPEIEKIIIDLALDTPSKDERKNETSNNDLANKTKEKQKGLIGGITTGKAIIKPEHAFEPVILKGREILNTWFPQCGFNKDEGFFSNCSDTEQKMMIEWIRFARKSTNRFVAKNEESAIRCYLSSIDRSRSIELFGFRKRVGEPITFFYRPDPALPNEQFMVADDFNNTNVRGVIRKLFDSGFRAIANQRVSGGAQSISPAGSTIQPRPSESIKNISESDFFFRRLKPNERNIIRNAVSVFRKYCKNGAAVNTRHSISFSLNENDELPLFEIRKTNNGSLEIRYYVDGKLRSEGDINKFAATIRGLFVKPKPAAPKSDLPAAKKEPGRPESKSSVAADKPVELDLKTSVQPQIKKTDKKAVLYLPEILEAKDFNGSPNLEDISLWCAQHHYTYLEKSEAAFSNSYRAFPEAIYQSEIAAKNAHSYQYHNPFNSKAYDRAISNLQDNFKIFTLGRGEYITDIGLKNRYGITGKDVSTLRDMLAKYLAKHFYFTFEGIRKHCAKCRFFTFDSSDEILMQFVHSFFGRKARTIVRDQDSGKAIHESPYIDKGPEGFFLQILGNRSSMDIYEIQSRVEDLYEVRYELDSIGKDAQKAGFFFSEDLEKVYLDKKYFYKEIAS